MDLKKNKNITDLHKGISEFKNSDQPRNYSVDKRVICLQTPTIF
jgi:hypothetical protein